jgi:TRAP-type mannitol/chloroaromatic compound transport system permease small subunit
MLGYAALVDTILKNKPKMLKWLIILCITFVVWNVILIVRYVLEDVPRSGAVPMDRIIVGQFTAIPRYLGRIIQIIITRN